MIYKLTTKDHTTYGGMKWGPGVTHRATGEKSDGLCSPGFIHAYTDPNLAVLLNPLHGDVQNPVLWECRGKVYESDGLKIGCRQLTTLKTIPLPVFSTNQLVAFAIYCAQEVCDDEGFKKWALDWLSGKDRSEAAARAAGATGAAWAAAAAATWAAWPAAGAATWAAWPAASAAWPAAGAAEAARTAARDKAWAAEEIDLAALAKKALEIT